MTRTIPHTGTNRFHASPPLPRRVGVGAEARSRVGKPVGSTTWMRDRHRAVTPAHPIPGAPWWSVMRGDHVSRRSDSLERQEKRTSPSRAVLAVIGKPECHIRPASNFICSPLDLPSARGPSGVIRQRGVARLFSATATTKAWAGMGAGSCPRVFPQDHLPHAVPRPSIRREGTVAGRAISNAHLHGGRCWLNSGMGSGPQP